MIRREQFTRSNLFCRKYAPPAGRAVALALTAMAVWMALVWHTPTEARGTLRPLFFQVHLTNPLARLSRSDSNRILAGSVRGFREIGGPDMPVHLRVDPAIAEMLAKSHPSLRCTPVPFDDESAMSDRQFLGISDLRGLRPYYKLLPVDGCLPWGKTGEDAVISEDGPPYPVTLGGAEAWDPGRHVTVVQTGVTAMTRAFIPAVDRSGDVLSPVRYTRKITSRADIAVTSNEVSFLEPCTWPLKDRMLFCSPLRFFHILTESGFDVIELTGNHNNDFGSACNAASIDLIEKNGMTYFGGGKNTGDAERVRYVKVRNTTVAFVGFNEQGPEPAFASGTRPGAARLTRGGFERLIKEAAAHADVVIVTVQWANENDPVPWDIQKRYFHRAAELGADIMVSSSAHRAMGLEFYRGRFISYGLGNFLFDQMQSLNHRRGLIARYHLYRGRHVSTELIPYMIHDWSQPRLLHGADAAGLMREVFSRSTGPAFSRR
ncbi:MAG TPA: CapA family protein [Spirochaetota bacterium]|nr:CapA family protein [Spirochaetota bacterium]HPN12381.1 CapA family protein [Spirochaetota bacterium]